MGQGPGQATRARPCCIHQYAQVHKSTQAHPDLLSRPGRDIAAGRRRRRRYAQPERGTGSVVVGAAALPQPPRGLQIRLVGVGQAAGRQALDCSGDLGQRGAYGHGSGVIMSRGLQMCYRIRLQAHSPTTATTKTMLAAEAVAGPDTQFMAVWSSWDVIQVQPRRDGCTEWH